MLQHIIDVLLGRNVDSILAGFQTTHDQLGRAQQRADAARRAAEKRRAQAHQAALRHDATAGRIQRVRTKLGEFIS